jgi:transposase
MRRYAKAWPERVWAVEGANGVGRPLAQRLLEAGEQVVDVPAKLAARVRLFDTGHNRKTDAHDAHSIAVVVRTEGLRVLKVDGELEALRMLTDRREALSRRRVQTVGRLQALLAELLPGQAKKDITTGQAKAMLASVRPRDVAGKTRRRIAADELAELVGVEAKIKKADTELKAMVLDRHRRVGCLLRGAQPPPAVAGREPADEPHDPHRRDQPTAGRQRRPRLLPAQTSRRQEAPRSDPLPQAPDLRCDLPPARHRRPRRRNGRRPGRW